MMKLNTLSADIFDYKKIPERDRTVTLNRADGKNVKLSRNQIVATGRMLACEYSGRKLSERPDLKGKYESMLTEKGIDYATLAKLHKESKFLFCAAIADAAVGREPVSTYEQAIKGDYRRNATFWAAFNAIDVDVLSPIYPAVFEDVAAGGLMEIVKVAPGTTYEVNVDSNDVFLYEDSSWGSGRSTTKNYLYKHTVTLNPKVYSCNATIKWRQDVVDGESGKYYSALMQGMWNKMYAIFVQTLKAAAAQAKYIPVGLKAMSYTTKNFNRISTLVAAANGLPGREDLVAFGEVGALSDLLPTDGLGGAITGLQYGLGSEWFSQGYLPRVGKVSVVEVNPIIVPGTQNSSLDTIGFGNSIFIAAKGGRGYAPIYTALGDGSPIEITATPRETADFTIDINVGAYFDTKPVFASKLGEVRTA